jgi:acetylornithine/succinyldiaminopimelate/putrescine aminotransferase
MSGSGTERLATPQNRVRLGPAGLAHLSSAQALELYRRHINPGLAQLYGLLGTAQLDARHGEGAYLISAQGRRLLDFSCSLGITSLGHGHPRLAAAAQRFFAQHLIDAFKTAPSAAQAALAHDITCLLPPPLEVVFFSTSGAEAVEAALKLAARIRGGSAARFLCLTGSFHGKTPTTLPLTTSGGFQRGTCLGLPAESVLTIPYDDLPALERILAADRSAPEGARIAGVVVEPVQGQGLQTPSAGYLTGLIETCRRYGVLSIVDEVKTGVFRCGPFCSFQEQELVPDVIAISKGLAGGACALGAMVTSPELFERAYGARRDAALHTTTLGGLGLSVELALETLDLLADPEHCAQRADLIASFDAGLAALAAAHPRRIVGLRGKGYLRGLELRFDLGLLPEWVKIKAAGPWRSANALCMAALVRRLQEAADLVTHFCASDPEVLHLCPPLVLQAHELDQGLRALDRILAEGPLRWLRSLV